MVALLVEDDEAPKWLLANLGDSRIYRFVDGELEQVSVDHSLVQELVDEGSITREEMGTHPARHVVTRALGGPDRADADYFLLPLPRAERILLCSDGITEMIDDEAVATIVGEAVDPRDAADRLVAEAVAGRWSRQRHGRRGRCDGIGERSCLRLRAAARESRAQVGSPAGMIHPTKRSPPPLRSSASRFRGDPENERYPVVPTR